jgi:hypothetical protein
MKQARKRLKLSSIAVLCFVVLDLFMIAIELLFGELNNATIPEGAPENILLITKIILLVISLLLLLPQIYIGVKGLQIAKNPYPAKGHIVWAIIIMIFFALFFVESVWNIINLNNVYDNVTTSFDILLQAVIYFDYIKYAITVLREC